MTTRLLLAPPGGGKTAYVVERVRALPPLSSARVLVPDHAQATAFRRRLALAGGGLGVEVQTFYDLYAGVLAVAGGALTIPPMRPGQPLARLLPPVRQRLIRHVVETACEAGSLSYHAPLRDSPGFVRLLGDLFAELKRARVLPEDLERALVPSSSREGKERRNERLAELSHLFSAYQSWLLDTGWVDAEGQGWLAAIALEQDPALLSGLSLLAVDGFDEFNPTQLHVLRLLAGRAEEAVVTLTGDPERADRLAHRRVARARDALAQALSPSPLPSLPPSPSLPPLAHLEAHLFEPGAPLAPAGDEIVLLEAQDRATEAREALRWLKARIVRDGVSPCGVAVVARDVEPYRPLLEDVAAEFGMALRFASGAGLGANPAIAALLNLLALPVAPVDWAPRALFDALAAPYFDWGLGGGDGSRLYDAACAGQVVAGLDQWREAFRRLAAAGPEGAPAADDDLLHDASFDGEGDLAPRRPPTGAEAARLADVFERVVARIVPPSRASLRERVAWVEELIGGEQAAEGASIPGEALPSSLRVVARARENGATAARDVAALCAFKDVLRGQVLAGSVLGGDRDDLPHDLFVAEVARAVAAAACSPPAGSESVVAASAPEIRGLTFDSVALLGLAETEFPRAGREEGLLRESDRAWLAERGIALDPRLQGDEAPLFYQAVTRARRRLLLCRPCLGDDGQPWAASPYWSAVQALFENVAPRRVRAADPVSDPASEQERVAAGPAGELDLAAVIRARSRDEPSPWNGDLSTLAGRLAQRFGADRPWSSSRLETYARCPFYFWAAYVMELEPREPPQEGFDVLILGSIYHLVLERLYTRVPDGDPGRLRAELPAVARQVYDAAPGDYGFRPTPLWERRQEEMTGVLSRTVDALIEVAGEYTPLEHELPFGLKERPPLVVGGQGEGLPLRLRGYIDRVDRAPDGRLRVVDYKAGSTPITARDLAEGRRLQLPLYALAAQEALAGEVAGGFYWHVGAARPSSLRLEKVEGGVPAAIDAAVEHALAITAAVAAGRFTPTPPGAGCSSFCPAVVFCERYRARTY